MAKKTAKQHLAAEKEPKFVILEKNWGGMKEGDRMFVATPRIVDEYIRAIPYGQIQTIPEIRDKLAQENNCAGTCPMSTSIFVRISAQAALEDKAQGLADNEITPFWRVITSQDKIAKKLDIDGEWIDHQRRLESQEAKG